MCVVDDPDARQRPHAVGKERDGIAVADLFDGDQRLGQAGFALFGGEPFLARAHHRATAARRAHCLVEVQRIPVQAPLGEGGLGGLAVQHRARQLPKAGQQADNEHPPAILAAKEVRGLDETEIVERDGDAVVLCIQHGGEVADRPADLDFDILTFPGPFPPDCRQFHAEQGQQHGRGLADVVR